MTDKDLDIAFNEAFAKANSEEQSQVFPHTFTGHLCPLQSDICPEKTLCLAAASCSADTPHCPTVAQLLFFQDQIQASTFFLRILETSYDLHNLLKLHHYTLEVHLLKNEFLYQALLL